MEKAINVAKYFLSKDPGRVLFNKNMVNYNNRTFYEGNARLNKYLFLAQVVYLAKFGTKLIEDDFLAYDNGPVTEDVRTKYARLLHSSYHGELDARSEDFLDKIYYSLKDATWEELIEISHEDPEWIRLKNLTFHAPVMNIENNINEYKYRYDGLIKAIGL